MDIDNKLLLGRLDGFLDATSFLKAANRQFVFAAFVIENCLHTEELETTLKEHYREEQAVIRIINKERQLVPLLESELAYILKEIASTVRSELIWQVVEMLRMLTDDFSAAWAAKCHVSLQNFEGLCYVLSLNNDYIVLQFFERN